MSDPNTRSIKPANGAALFALIVCLSNAIAHLMVLTGIGDLTLYHTWPFHLLAMLMFLAMMFSLFANTAILGQDLHFKAQRKRGELYEYARKIESEQAQQTTWQKMFGKTPVWVGILCGVLFVYSFGVFAIEGFQFPYSIVDRDGELWLYDDYDGWVRRATSADSEREKFLEIRFATSAFTLFAFLPWAYFQYRSSSVNDGSREHE